MIGRLGMPELIIIAIIAILIFGPRQLPKFGKALGDTVREVRGIRKAFTEAVDETKTTASTLTDEIKK